MQDLFRYVGQNPQLIFLFFGLSVVWTGAVFYFGGKKAEAIFRDLDLSKVKFREKGASGYSQKSFRTRFGGANKVLDIIVTDTELCIKGIYSPFSYLGMMNDLTHRFGLTNIRNIEQSSTEVELSFASGHNIVLKLKDPQQFINAIKAG
jgi:hypothetical protein